MNQRVCMLALAAAGLVYAQPKPVPATTLSFEVASIKRHDSSRPNVWRRIPSSKLQGTSGNLYRMQSVTLVDLIRDAYYVKNYQVSGGPAWGGASGDQFDITAKAAEPAPSERQFRSMLQSLLADRFRLRLHRETKELPVYELVVAKGGPKIKEVPAGAKSLGRERLEPGGPQRGPMELLLLILSEFVDRPIVDKTTLTASEYEFRLDTREPAAELRLGLPAPSIFSVAQQQLGLKLTPVKAALELLVIDSAEKPTAN